MARRIVVIGGGVVGCSIAWHLAQRDLGEVVLLERDRIGSGTTWHSAGNLTWRPGASHDASVLYAFDTIARLTAETGQETGWLKTGRLFLAHGPAAIRRLESCQKAAEERRISRIRSIASGSANCSPDMPVTNRPPRISPRASRRR